MIRLITSVWPVALLALGMAACAGPGARPGEPTPKPESALAPDETGAAPAAEAVETAEAGQEPAGPQATTPPPAAPESVAPPPAPPPFAAPLVLAAKPRIVAKVDTVQFPAWVERGGVKAAVKAGWAIFTGDRITTGAEGRLVLGLVGEGRMQVSGGADIAMTPAYESTGGPEPSLLKLNRGTIRLSAPLVRTGMPGLPLEIGKGIQANVMGGSIVAMADGNEDLLALLDGFVQITGDKLNPGSMKTEHTFLRVPRVGRASAVAEASPDRLARWVSGTELVRNRPALDATGTWDVSLNSGYNLKILETMACRLQARGYPTEIYPVREPGKQVWYRVVVRRFRSKSDAVDFLGTARALGSREPWVLLPQT
jgi:hypothetical protein